MSKYFFLFWLLASSLAEGITMPDEQKWGPALLSAALSPGTPSCEWLCWHWSSFCSLKPRGEERWKETLYISACPNAPLPCNHRAGEFGLSTGVQRDICTADKMFGEPWPPTIPHDRMPKLHMVGVTAPSPIPKKPSPGWVFQSWSQRNFFSPWDHTKMLSKAWWKAILCQSSACKFASGLTMFYHWQQCKMLLRECSVHRAACSRSGRGKDRTPWILDSCSQGSINPTHLKVRHLLEASFLGFLCGQ